MIVHGDSQVRVTGCNEEFWGVAIHFGCCGISFGALQCILGVAASVRSLRPHAVPLTLGLLQRPQRSRSARPLASAHRQVGHLLRGPGVCCGLA
jgi:hypothetical protein